MPATHSTNQSQVQLDLEIEKTLRRLRKEARLNNMAIAQQQYDYCTTTNTQGACCS